MKEYIPAPPKEIFEFYHKDQKRLEKKRVKGESVKRTVKEIEYPPEGGIYIHYNELKYPKKGFPFPDVVDLMGLTKGTIFSTATIFARYWYLSFPLFFVRRKITKYFIHQAHEVLKKYYLLPPYYCKTAREIFNTLWLLGYRKNVCHLWACVFEYDNAYRYRLQDLIGEVQKPTLLNVLYALSICAKRDRPKMRKKWRVFALLAIAFRKDVMAFLKRANLSNMKLDRADKFFCAKRPDYDYCGYPLDKRIELWWEE